MDDHLTHIRETLHQTRAQQKRTGIFVSVFSFVVLLIAESAIPIGGPVSIFAGLLGIGAGFYLLYRHQELPISEAIEVAALFKGYLSAPLLIRALHITPATAERILAELVQRGYTRVEEQSMENGEVAYRVLGLTAPSAPPSLPPGEPGAPSP